ncbi:uncharacterized protein PV07_11121 [Cladophialophora immunda]|uniref:Uncharacterized protein n=1 Tax=Cladophialophora immunda TaxID=569365 RepID=A0A0D2BWY5_9EURO|nr:uncharacterized protein PV07_11121 [Cladophialophora immunda]KIW22870.1 hypothetical protein PV07_11121 [Cladophialophora immunda]OQU93868.1 hypothetical protein CLAIMM_00323 [Cladophialophora immunda]
MSTSKPKAFLKQSKSKKKAEQALETVDDFQAAGVDFEEAAGKWRAGDAVKSMRFFSRAIEVYDQGLQTFPTSIDLAYNKARVLLEIATHPLLVPHLHRPLLEVLQQALEAHRYALTLDQDNPDTLFNTAQVLTAIAEVCAKDVNRADQDVLQLLEEALELQNRCLSIQELKLEEYMQQQDEAATQIASENATEPTSVTDEGNPGSSAVGTEDQWFSVVEPVTKDTLIDTILAQLGTLTTLSSFLSSSDSVPISSLGYIEEYSSKLVKTKLPPLLQDAEPERLQEVALARANLASELLKAGYLLGSIDPTTYKRERDEAFQMPELELERSFPALLANANSLIAFNSALADGEASNAVSHASMRWSALAAAITNMATASKISGPLPEDIAETHFIRGNCSLLQHQLGQPPISYNAAIANGPQLLKNAETFYRNASKLYQDPEQKAASQLRAVVAQAIQAQIDIASAAVQHDQGRDQEWVRVQLDDMADDGLIAPLAQSL